MPGGLLRNEADAHVLLAKDPSGNPVHVEATAVGGLHTGAFDIAQSADKTLDQSPAKDWYTDSVNLVTASDIGAANTVSVDQGSEIDLRGTKQFALWVDFTVNNSTGNDIIVLFKNESGGAKEYILETAGDYTKTLGNASIVIVYKFTTDNLFPFVQVQSVAAVVGAVKGTLTIDVTKSY